MVSIVRLARSINSVLSGMLWCVTVLMLSGVLVLIYKSRSWGLIQDPALWHYVAWLITEGAVPYRDIFDVNFPGTYAIHLFVITCMGAGDVQWRIFDLLCLGAINGFILLYCKPFGKLAGLIGVALFSAFHLYSGPLYVGLRDYILLVFLLGALYFFARRLEHGKGVALLLSSGLLLGAAVSIKPYAGLLCFFLLIMIVAQALRAGKSWFMSAAAFTLACFVVPALLMLWLWYAGGLTAFLDILFNYLLPFYSKFVLRGWTQYDLYVFIGIQVWEIIAMIVIALAVTVFDAEHRTRRLLLCIGMAYGFFHFYFQVRNTYQLYPFIFFMFLNIATWSSEIRRKIPALLKWAMVLVLVHVCLIVLWRTSRCIITVPPPPFRFTRFSCTDSLVADLEGRVAPGGTVQVMDCVGGQHHALFEMRLRQPTRFIYDGHFFHNMDDSYIQSLRREFMDNLRQSPPEFLVFSILSWPINGYDRLKNFPDLAEWLTENYEFEAERECYRLYRLRKP